MYFFIASLNVYIRSLIEMLHQLFAYLKVNSSEVIYKTIFIEMTIISKIINKWDHFKTS